VARSCEAVRSGAVMVLGPAPAPIARVRGRYRFRVMLRARERALLRAVLVRVDDARALLPRDVRASIDIDPVQLL
jgi:primosomal protein N' (replication factor Y)